MALRVQLLLFILGLPVSAFCQTFDVIYLKDSTVVEGTILEMDTRSQVKIQTPDKQVYIIDAARVERIVTVPGKLPRARGDYQIKDRGFFNETEVGLHFGMTSEQYYYYYRAVAATFSFRCTNGYQLNRYLRAGLGFGLEVYQSYPFTPVFARAGGSLFDGAVSALYWAEAGKGFGWDEIDTVFNYYGGLTWGAGTGMRFNSRGRVSFQILMGVRSLAARFETYDYWTDSKTIETRHFNRFVLAAGLTF
jgi:hypothetical protein